MHDYAKDACLLTDFYQFTMAQAYFDKKRHETEAVFHLFFRKYPFGGNWAIAAGINDALSFVSNFHISDDAIAYLASLNAQQKPLFSKNFLTYLKTAKLEIDIKGVIDGEVVFPHEPLIRVQGPLFLCQLLETPLLNIINFQTLIATKAARIKIAAGTKDVVDFGLRRAQGFDGGITATKAAFIGGIDKTSNVWAAKSFGITPSGTQAHSFIMSYDSQAHAFDDYCSSFKDSAVLLVDTYDPLTGIDDAIASFKKLAALGSRPRGLRIDSGDMSALSKTARARLDLAGFNDCAIIASGDLDEYAISKLEQDRAPIDAYGVGTRLVTAYDDPALSGVYKLASIIDKGGYRDTYKSSATREKQTWPGQHGVARFFKNNRVVFDMVYDVRSAITLPQKTAHDAQAELHVPLMEKSVIVMTQSLTERQQKARESLAQLPAELLSLHKAKHIYPVYFDDNITHKLVKCENAAYEEFRESPLAD